jgi:hypothetical protein
MSGIEIVAVVEECGDPLKVTVQDVPDGKPDSVKVTVGFATNEAVSVMALFTVMVCDELLPL